MDFKNLPRGEMLECDGDEMTAAELLQGLTDRLIAEPKLNAYLVGNGVAEDGKVYRITLEVSVREIVCIGDSTVH